MERKQGFIFRAFKFSSRFRTWNRAIGKTREERSRIWPGFPSSQTKVCRRSSRGSVHAGAASARLAHIRGRFAGGRNILGTGSLHDVLGDAHVVGSRAVHGKQNAALLDASLITLGLIFGDA